MSIKRIFKKLMITVTSIIAVLFIALAAWFFILGQRSQSGNPPGLVDNRLAQCPVTPNCVCSEYANDSLHFISAINLSSASTSSDSSPDLHGRIKSVITQMGGIIQQEQNNYLAATFTSAIFRFVDDFEVRTDEQLKVVHVRSASRVGKGDLGVNRKRVEQFRTLLLKGNTASHQ